MKLDPCKERRVAHWGKDTALLDDWREINDSLQPIGEQQPKLVTRPRLDSRDPLKHIDQEWTDYLRKLLIAMSLIATATAAAIDNKAPTHSSIIPAAKADTIPDIWPDMSN